MRPPAGGADLVSGRFDVGARAREEPDFGAGLRKRDRAGAADAAARAGDVRGAAVESEAGGGVQGAAILNGVRPHFVRAFRPRISSAHFVRAFRPGCPDADRPLSAPVRAHAVSPADWNTGGP